MYVELLDAHVRSPWVCAGVYVQAVRCHLCMGADVLQRSGAALELLDDSLDFLLSIKINGQSGD